MKRAAAFGLAVGLLIVSGAPAVAQTEEEQVEPQPAALRMEAIDTSGHPDITMTVSVPRELLGIDLADSGFTVREGGVTRPASVVALTTDDLQVVLALDVSGSMAGEPLTAAKDAAATFVGQMPAGVEMAVVAFGNEPTVVREFTTDPDEALAAIATLRTGGETALYDGLRASAALFSDEDGFRRTVVLLSDGGDTVSSSGIEQVLIDLLDRSVGFYAVELQTPENDSQPLNRLGIATGGTVVPAGDPAALAGIFDEIATQLVNRYEISFTSESFGATEIQISAQAEGVAAAAIESVRLPQPPPPPPVAVTAAPGPETSPVATTIPPLRSGSVISVSWIDSAAAFYLGVGAVFLAAVGLMLLTRPKAPTVKLSEEGIRVPIAPEKKRNTFSGLADRATEMADKSLSKSGRRGRLNAKLEKAGVAMRPAEFTVLTASGALGAAALGFASLGPIFAIAFAAMAVLGIRLWLNIKADKRSMAFGDQLGDNLQLMAGSLRAGYGLLQAIDAVASEAPSPSAEEFTRIKVEGHLGRDLNEALRAMAARVDSEDFLWVAEAIEIHREIGGDLAEILDAVNETIRDRNQIRRRIKALSAEGRISAIILSILPIVLAVIVYFINPTYLSELSESLAGQVMVAMALVAMVVGIGWMRKIIKLQF
jgi:tight adherence protein B